MDWDFVSRRALAGFCQVFGMNGCAVAVYRKLLARWNDAPCARVAALLSAKAGRLDEAEHWYAKAAEWAPEDAETWFNLGYLRDALGRKREACEAFRQAVRIVPHFDRAWHAIGMMHIALGEHALAIEPLRKAYELQPTNLAPLYQMGTCQHACNNDKAVRETVLALEKLDHARARLLVEETGRRDLQKLLRQD